MRKKISFFAFFFIQILFLNALKWPEIEPFSTENNRLILTNKIKISTL